ncbi:MAG: MBOAT family protein [Reichenbachiella sp.]
MIFNSFPFLFFITTFIIIYYSVKSKNIKVWLCLVGSYFFYSWWDWRFLSLILLSTAIDFNIGILIRKYPWKKKVFLLISIIANLGILATFKYLNFFISSFQDINMLLGFQTSVQTLNIILPVGVSFYTFQTLSYTIDIYRGNLKPETSYLNFSTFVAFFPQLVAGPIVRASHFLPQLRKNHIFNGHNFISGIRLIAVGFFKKIVIADSAALIIDRAFELPESYSSINLIIVIILYAIQIYCDFSGYSDIAIGVARLLGYHFPMNFNFPYFAKNFSDFWSRWHISLSSWLKDYLYISIGGNRKGQFSTYINLMVTMILGGLWHGASWNFIVWGLLHGLYLIFQRLFAIPFNRIRFEFNYITKQALLLMSILITFSLTCFAWIFFRSQNFEQAMTIIHRIFSFNDLSIGSIKHKVITLKIVVLAVGFMVSEIVLFRQKSNLIITEIPARAIQTAILLWLIILFGTYSSNQFIYFQF